MTDKNSKHTKDILTLARRHYTDGEDFIQPNVDGDGLARFIYHEICEVTDGCETFEEAVEEAATALATAVRELEAIIYAVRKAGYGAAVSSSESQSVANPDPKDGTDE
jgi:hypothetical protein